MSARAPGHRSHGRLRTRRTARTRSRSWPWRDSASTQVPIHGIPPIRCTRADVTGAKRSNTPEDARQQRCDGHDLRAAKPRQRGQHCGGETAEAGVGAERHSGAECGSEIAQACRSGRQRARSAGMCASVHSVRTKSCPLVASWRSLPHLLDEHPARRATQRLPGVRGDRARVRSGAEGEEIKLTSICQTCVRSWNANVTFAWSEACAGKVSLAVL